MNNQRINILCVIQSLSMPSSRIRILQMVPYLEKHGIFCHTAIIPKKVGSMLELLKKSREYDLIWLQKECPGLIQGALWRLAAPPIIYDVDDAVCFRELPEWGSYQSRSRQKRFNRIMSICDSVTCGNAYLAGLIKQPKPHLIYPSPVPLDGPVRRHFNPRGSRILVWVGLSSNFPSLETILSDLKEVCAQHPFTLRVISDKTLEKSPDFVENIQWTQETQETLISECDIGIMPLSQTSPYDRGKCAYKLLQYMASGIVPVGTAAGMNIEVLADPENGRLVSGGWQPVVKELLTVEPDVLRDMGRNARQAAVQKYSYDVQARRLADFFKKRIDH